VITVGPVLVMPAPARIAKSGGKWSKVPRAGCLRPPRTPDRSAICRAFNIPASDGVSRSRTLRELHSKPPCRLVVVISGTGQPALVGPIKQQR
jgi:hypothetical protein